MGPQKQAFLLSSLLSCLSVSLFIPLPTLLRPSLIYSSVSPICCASHGWLHRKSFIVRLGPRRRISRSTCIFLSCQCHIYVQISEFEQVPVSAWILPWFRQEKLTSWFSSLMLLCVPEIVFVLHLFASVVNSWFNLKIVVLFIPPCSDCSGRFCLCICQAQFYVGIMLVCLHLWIFSSSFWGGCLLLVVYFFFDCHWSYVYTSVSVRCITSASLLTITPWWKQISKWAPFSWLLLQ